MIHTKEAPVPPHPDQETGTYLRAENQRLEVGEIESGWWSAMWTFEVTRADEAPESAGLSYELRGESMADGQLRQAILEQVLVAFSVASDCDLASVEAIETSVEKVDRDAGGSVAGALERWVASGCGVSLPDRTTLTVSPPGGVDFRIASE